MNPLYLSVTNSEMSHRAICSMYENISTDSQITVKKFQIHWKYGWPLIFPRASNQGFSHPCQRLPTLENLGGISRGTVDINLQLPWSYLKGYSDILQKIFLITKLNWSCFDSYIKAGAIQQVTKTNKQKKAKDSALQGSVLAIRIIMRRPRWCTL